MSKILHCRDVGFDCDAVVRADSEEEILKQAAAHAESVHGVVVTPEIAAQVKAVIRDDRQNSQQPTYL